MRLIPAIFAAALLAAPAALAEERTLRLSVPGMFCASCDYIVRAAAGRIDGVQTVSADTDARKAEVVFDDTLTSAGAIQAALMNAGYESTVIGDGS